MLLACALSALALFVVHTPSAPQQFADEARSLAAGHLWLDETYTSDVVVRDGRSYFPLPPFPALLLVPFQLVFGPRFNQVPLQAALCLLLAVLLYRLARVKGYSPGSSLWLTAAFLFGSVAIGLLVRPSSWYLSQVIAMAALSAVLLEIETRDRAAVSGALCGILFATRPPAALILVMLAFRQWRKPGTRRERIARLAVLALSAAILPAVWMGLNQARFGDPFETGYGIAVVQPNVAAVRQLHGLWDVRYLPKNLRLYFAAGPHVVRDAGGSLAFPYATYDPEGLSLLLVAPFFLNAFRSLRLRDVYLKGLWCVVLVTLASLLVYYHAGWVQFGPRYTADFLPLLYVLTLAGLARQELTPVQERLIAASATLNTLLLWSYAYLRFFAPPS